MLNELKLETFYFRVNVVCKFRTILAHEKKSPPQKNLVKYRDYLKE